MSRKQSRRRTNTKSEALPFIVWDKTASEWKVTDAARKALTSIEGPFGVLCIAGLYRTGKSFILNRIIGQQNGFALGGTVNACTKGIWMWSHVVPMYPNGPGGAPLPVLLIDTEGLGATDQDRTHDAQVFSLALLLSSLFVYNSVGTIDEQALGQLSFVTHLSQHLQQQRSDGAVEPVSDAAPYFPSFMWLVRDFVLSLEDNHGRSISEDEYLERALNERSSHGRSDKDDIRRSVKQYFRQRSCCTLPRPVVEEDQLRNMDSLPYDALRPKFRAAMTGLQERLQRGMQPKQLHGHALTGRAFAALAAAYVDALNSGGVPEIQSAWQQVRTLECQSAVEAALSAYNHALNESVGSEDQLPIDMEQLVAFHEAAKSRALALFHRKAIGDVASFQTSLEQRLADYYGQARAKNESASHRSCVALLTELWTALNEAVTAGRLSSFGALDAAWAQLHKAYEARARGPAKWVTFVPFVMTHVGATYTGLANGLVEQHRVAAEAAIATERKAMATERQRADAQAQSWAKERGALEKRLASRDAVVERLHADVERVRQRVETAQAEAKQAVDRAEAEARKRVAEAQARIQALSHDEALAQQRIELASDRTQALEKDLQSTQQRYERQVKDLQKQLKRAKSDAESRSAELRAREVDLTSTVEETEQTWQRRLEETRLTLEVEVSEAEAREATALKESDRLRRQLADGEARYTELQQQLHQARLAAASAQSGGQASPAKRARGAWGQAVARSASGSDSDSDDEMVNITGELSDDDDDDADSSDDVTMAQPSRRSRTTRASPAVGSRRTRGGRATTKAAAATPSKRSKRSRSASAASPASPSSTPAAVKKTTRKKSTASKGAGEASASKAYKRWTVRELKSKLTLAGVELPVSGAKKVDLQRLWEKHCM